MNQKFISVPVPVNPVISPQQTFAGEGGKGEGHLKESFPRAGAETFRGEVLFPWMSETRLSHKTYKCPALLSLKEKFVRHFGNVSETRALDVCRAYV